MDDGDRAIRVTGRDRADFLRRILAGEVPAPGGLARTALLTPKGALIAAATASTTTAEVVLETEPSRRQPLLAKLDLYRISDDVKLTPLDGEDNRSLLVQGQSAGETVAEALAALGWSLPEGLDPGGAPPGAGVDIPGEAGGVCLVRRLFRPWPAWRVRFLDAPDAATRVGEFLAARRAAAGPEEDDYLRVAAGEPAWGSELDEASRVAECGLAAHARLGRGCYIGQEFVARQAHRGRIPRLLRRLAFDPGHPLPAPQSDLGLDGEKAGRLTSAARPPEGGAGALPGLGLAILNAAVPPGAVVTSEADPGEFRARVLPD